ncbi:MAG TPA: exodeoxyribonuclease V subunit gamma [Kofleriaceae bacterium]|nr:exodeoxyribonuclease V subunit gamma [Kofleriaceae bacterium]
MLRVVHGNRVEALYGALEAALPACDPFAPSTIVVGSRLVARWLSREVALSRGVAAGLELVTFDAFVATTWAGDAAARDAGLVPLDRAQLAAAIASVLADDRVAGALPAVAAYLAAADDRGDRAGPRRVQLADRVAGVIWQYALTRPDWMPALATGRVPDELANDDTARWQATLFAAALARAGAARDATVAPLPMLPWARRRAGLPAPRGERAVSVFGMSYLSRAQLEALSDLAATTPVTVYMLDPCELLWDDIAARRADSEQPLLAQWGRAVQGTMAALVERSGGDVDGAFVGEPARTAVHALLGDIATLAGARGPTPDRPGLSVLACPNARREIEQVAAEARARLDADPSLRAHELAVWIASDALRYLALAPSAFEAVGVPFHLIDAPIDDRGRIGELVLALLDLPTSAMTRRDVLRVMTHPAVLAGYPHVDAEDWVRWTEQLGIVHGANADAHAGTYLAAHPDKFHWDQGVRRLALGAFMVGDAASGRGPAAIGGLEVVPEPVRPDQQPSAATYALLVRSLCADAAWLASHEAPLAGWAAIFVGLVDAYVTRPRTARAGVDRASELERVRAMLAGLAHVDLDGRPVGFREAREHVVRELEDAHADRGEPLAAGVMIAPLQAMRAVPARVAFVVGLAEGAFPAGELPSALDVRRTARPGDVSPRDRDRHAFFEVVLGARDELVLSYVAMEAKSGEPLGPSSVVLELADALAPYLADDVVSSRTALARISRRVALHRHADGGALPPVVERERWAARVRDAARAHLRARGHDVPDEDGMLALVPAPLRDALGLVAAPDERATAAPDRPISLASLRAFLESPVQAWAQVVLGLDELPDGETIDHSDEPFHLDRPTRAQMLREVLAAMLLDPSREPGAHYDAVARDLELRGQFPVGVFGDAARARDLRTLDHWRAALGPIEVGAITRLAFGRSRGQAELMPPLELELSGGRTVRLVGQTELLARGTHAKSASPGSAGARSNAERCAVSIVPILGELKTKSRYHLRGALDHVVLAAAGLANTGHSHVVFDGKGHRIEIEHGAWSRDEARAYLRGLVEELLDMPHGYLLPFEQLVRASHGERGARPYDEDRALGYGPIERSDGLAPPDDATAIAERRLAPLVTRMRGEHGFGGRR